MSSFPQLSTKVVAKYRKHAEGRDVGLTDEIWRQVRLFWSIDRHKVSIGSLNDSTEFFSLWTSPNPKYFRKAAPDLYQGFYPRFKREVLASRTCGADLRTDNYYFFPRCY